MWSMSQVVCVDSQTPKKLQSRICTGRVYAAKNSLRSTCWSQTVAEMTSDRKSENTEPHGLTQSIYGRVFARRISLQSEQVTLAACTAVPSLDLSSDTS